MMRIFNDPSYKNLYKSRIIDFNESKRLIAVKENINYVTKVLYEKFNIEDLDISLEKQVVVFKLKVKDTFFKFGFPLSRFEGQLDQTYKDILATEISYAILSEWKLILVKQEVSQNT